MKGFPLCCQLEKQRVLLGLELPRLEPELPSFPGPR